MPTRKRKINVEENINEDGERSVNVQDEQSVSSSTDNQQEEAEQEDERYTPASGN